jgi:hypothetical protein
MGSLVIAARDRYPNKFCPCCFLVSEMRARGTPRSLPSMIDLTITPALGAARQHLAAVGGFDE